MAVNVNEYYSNIQNNYLFVEIARRVEKYQEENPDADLIKMGIGDVTRPLTKTVIKAFHDAVDEMGQADTFRGYGPEQGYDFLIEDVIKNDFNPLGVELKNSEVFISDGAKCDTGNFQELFSQTAKSHSPSISKTDLYAFNPNISPSALMFIGYISP